MIRRIPATLAAVLLAATLAGCGSDDTAEPAVAKSSSPAATSAAPSPSDDSKDRRGCRAVADLPANRPDPTVVRDAGALAAEATTQAIAQAGVQLVSAVAKLTADPGFDSNMAVDRAILAVAEACGAQLGDGPW